MRSYLLLLFCATLYGSNFVLGSLLLQAFPALHLSAYRLVVSSVFLLIYLAATRHLTKITLRDSVYLVPFVLIGMLLHQVSFFTGLRTTDATTASLILFVSSDFYSAVCPLIFERTIYDPHGRRCDCRLRRRLPRRWTWRKLENCHHSRHLDHVCLYAGVIRIHYPDEKADGTYGRVGRNRVYDGVGLHFGIPGSGVERASRTGPAPLLVVGSLDRIGAAYSGLMRGHLEWTDSKSRRG